MKLFGREIRITKPVERMNVEEREVARLKEIVRADAVDWVIKRFVTNGQWSQEERNVFTDFYTQLATWESEIDTATDIKALHRKTFDVTTHREKMRGLS